MKPITDEMEEICNKESKRIIEELIQKFPERNVRDFDIIFNSLAMGLVIFRSMSTSEENYDKFLELLTHVLSQND